MKKTMSRIGFLSLLCLPVSTAVAQTRTVRIVSAANGFLSTLDQ